MQLRSIATWSLWSCLALAGCGGDGSTAASGSGGGGSAPTFHYPHDGELRVNHLQAKGTHNSYHDPTADAKMVMALDYTHPPLGVQLASEGVRQIELDTHFNAATGELEVYHLYLIDEGTTCRRFIDCLKAVKKWSDKNPAHHPIFIQIEPKDSPTSTAEAEAYFALLESEVVKVFPRERVIAPDEVKGSAASVRDALAANGWPTLGKARGRIAFFIDNHDTFRDFYTHGGKDIDGRIMFIDAEPTDAWAGIILANDPKLDADRIKAALAASLIVRTRADSDNVEPFAGDTSVRDAALASGAQLVTTDYPVPVMGVNYVVDVPGGTPSRCSPITAPADCVSTDIEDPQFIEPP